MVKARYLVLVFFLLTLALSGARADDDDDEDDDDDLQKSRESFRLIVKLWFDKTIYFFLFSNSNKLQLRMHFRFEL